MVGFLPNPHLVRNPAMRMVGEIEPNKKNSRIVEQYQSNKPLVAASERAVRSDAVERIIDENAIEGVVDLETKLAD